MKLARPPIPLKKRAVRARAWRKEGVWGRNSATPEPKSASRRRKKNVLLCSPSFGGRKRWGGVSNHSSDFRSKKVRASFSNCDQSKHCEFCGQFICSFAQTVRKQITLIHFNFDCKSGIMKL